MDYSLYLEHYDRVTKKGTCKSCKKLVPWNRVNLASHKRTNCINVSPAEKEIFRLEVHSSPGSSQANISDPQENPLNVSGGSTANQPYELTAEKKLEIDTAFGNFCYRTGIPFRVAESDSFRDFVKLLNPSYAENMPKARTISGRLLDEQYDKSFAKLTKILNDSSELGLITDGWTNVRGDHIVNFLIKAPGQPTVFYKSIDTSGVIQNEMGVAQAISDILEELGSGKFTSVITDHAPVI